MFLSQQLHSNILVITSSAMRVEKPQNLELTLNRIGKKGVLAVPFNKNTVSHFNEKIKIFVTLSQ